MYLNLNITWLRIAWIAQKKDMLVSKIYSLHFFVYVKNLLQVHWNTMKQENNTMGKSLE